jgi:hypothetical protein
METQVVFGGYGELTVDRATGNVVSYEPSGDGSDYEDIVRVDIPESLNNGNNTDILFCGLYFTDPNTSQVVYEAPCWNAEKDSDGNVTDMSESDRAALKASRS